MDIKGNAGQVVEEWSWKLTQYYGDILPYKDPFYSLEARDDGWYIVAHPGCVWDYATGWFDFDYIKEASLGHDILHWLIALGIIETRFNPAIDREFYELLRQRGSLSHWRAKWLHRAVKLAWQKKTGIDRPVIYLLNGKRL